MAAKKTPSPKRRGNWQTLPHTPFWAGTPERFIGSVRRGCCTCSPVLGAATQTCPARSSPNPPAAEQTHPRCRPSCPHGLSCSRKSRAEPRRDGPQQLPSLLTLFRYAAPTFLPSTPQRGVQGTPVSLREALASALITAFLLPAVH